MNVGDVPTIRITRHGEAKMEYGTHRFGLTIDEIKRTGHIVLLPEPDKRQCHKCGARVGTYFTKPGSQFVWCLECS